MSSQMEVDSVEGDESDIDSDDSDYIFDGGKWIRYVVGSARNKEPFDTWLPNNLPSNVSKEDGYAWISVSNPYKEDIGEDRDIDGLMLAWEGFLKSGRPVSFENIRELGCNHNVLSGKWLFFAASGGKIDTLWSIVAKNIVTQKLPCKQAKVSCYEGGRHVVCIYNDNFTDLDEVFQSEQAIRNMGIKCELMYKPDVYTWLDIYSKNEWNISPVLYRKKQKQAKILYSEATYGDKSQGPVIIPTSSMYSIRLLLSNKIIKFTLQDPNASDWFPAPSREGGAGNQSKAIGL